MSEPRTACGVCGDGMLGIGYTCTGCGRVGESTDIYDRHRSVCMDRDRLAAELAEVRRDNERLKDLNGRVVPFGIIAAEAKEASQPPVHVEPDDSLAPRPEIFRIVRDEDARRFRDEYRTTARRPYIATVYNRRDAEFISLLYNHGHHLIVRHHQLRSLLREACDIGERLGNVTTTELGREYQRDQVARLSTIRRLAGEG